MNVVPFPLLRNIFQYHFSNALSLIADGRQNKENYQKDSSKFTGRFIACFLNDACLGHSGVNL